ncbi:hydroxyisourate hydrolase [Microbacterium sediminicola]|uniref:5-hydroxyisourate hydrolase n=1 Tax=Microbacterium sediminicola TaxID=415210 RepID=A0ABP4UJ06_9MICO
MTHLTTHILDANSGRPATAVEVILAQVDATGSTIIATGVTDDDGRLALGPDLLEPGTYALTFDTGTYFARLGTETFYPSATVTFTVDASGRHYHVPLLLSPFAYSTYRGS